MDLFIATGEISGDLLAEQVVKNLPPSLSIGGIIGPKLRALGVREYFPMELFEIHGLNSFLKGTLRILKHWRKILSTLLDLNPKVVLLVDNSEFSLRLAKALRKKGFQGKIVQLVCPTIWAWRKHRAKTLIENFDLVLSLFPFEKNYFTNTRLTVEFIGHPLMDFLNQPTEALRGQKKPIIAIFPGSRPQEIALNFPLQLRALKHLAQQYTFAVSVAKPHFEQPLLNMAIKEGVEIFLYPSEQRFSLMKSAEFAVAKCGTIIFELGIWQVPTIVVYKMPRIDLFFAWLFRVLLSHYSLPNILLGKRLFPEYVGPFALESLLKEEVDRFANLSDLKESIRLDCKNIFSQYESKSPGKLAASLIENLIFIPS